MKVIEVGYFVANGGDGSASAEFFTSIERAIQAEKKHAEQTGEPWGEDSAGTLRLYLEHGKVHMKRVEYIYEDDKLIGRQDHFDPVTVINMDGRSLQPEMIRFK